MTFQSKHLSIAIDRLPSEVYKFASNPINLPKWATGLSGAIKKEGDKWMSESPMGKVQVAFTEDNKYGILDHEVSVESGKVFYNPLRIMKNGDGSEVVFTLYRQPEMTDLEFEIDAEAVLKDLEALKNLLSMSALND